MGRTGWSWHSLNSGFATSFHEGGPSGWGRNLHFLAAWVCLVNGSVHVLSGMLTRHFRKDLFPAKGDLLSPLVEMPLSYNLFQTLTYLAVIFVLLPLMMWTGFAMSPTIVSVLSWLVTSLGGLESARTIHFLPPTCWFSSFSSTTQWCIWPVSPLVFGP